MSKFCKRCGMHLKDDAKFCGSCGTKMQETEASPPNMVPPIFVNKATKKTKPLTPPKKLLFSAVAVVLVIALGAAILPRLDKEVANTEGTTGDLSAFTYTEQDYTAKAKELKVSPQSRGSKVSYGTMIVWLLKVKQSLPSFMKGRLLRLLTDVSGVRISAFAIGYGERGTHMRILRYYPFSRCK